MFWLDCFLKNIQELDSHNFNLHLGKVHRNQRLQLIIQLLNESSSTDNDDLLANVVKCLSEIHRPEDILTPNEWLDLLGYKIPLMPQLFWHRIVEKGNLKLTKTVYKIIGRTEFLKLALLNDSDGNSSLHYAAASSNIDILDFFISKLCETNRPESIQDFYKQLVRKDHRGRNVLQVCCACDGKTDKVARVINKIFDPNSLLLLLADANEELETPIHTFLSWESTEDDCQLVMAIFDRLDMFGRRALIKRTDNMQRTLLHWAAHWNYENLLEYFLKNLYPEDLVALCRIVAHGNYSLFHLSMRNQNFPLCIFLCECELRSFSCSEDVHHDDSDWFSKIVTLVDNDGLNLLQHASSCRDDMEHSKQQLVALFIKQLTKQGFKIKSQTISNSNRGVTAIHSMVSHRDHCLSEKLLTGIAREDFLKVIHLQDRKGDTLLHRAAFSNTLEVFCALVDMCTGYKVDNIAELFSVRNKRGKTVLHCACYGHQSIIAVTDIILSHFHSQEDKYNILTAIDNFGDNPIDIAVTGHNTLLVSYLSTVLEDHKWKRKLLKEDWPKLHRAIINDNHTEMARCLLRTIRSDEGLLSPYILSLDDHLGDSVLHYIVRQNASGGQDKFMTDDLLPCLTLDELVNHVDLLGQTILHCAVIANNISLTKHLIEVVKARGQPESEALSLCALISKSDWFGKTVFRYAAEKSNIYLLEYLAEAIPSSNVVKLMQQRDATLQRNCWHHIIAYGDDTTLRKWVELILSIDMNKDRKMWSKSLLTVDCFGKTVLHYCMERGRLQAASYILDNVKKIGSTSHHLRQLILRQDKYYRRTALHYAVIQEHADKQLLIDLVCKQIEYCKPAAERERLTTKLIWKIRDRDGKSPVHYACEDRSWNTTNLLLSKTPNGILHSECFINKNRQSSLLHTLISNHQPRAQIKSLLNKLNPEYVDELFSWRDSNGNNAVLFAAEQTYDVFHNILDLLPARSDHQILEADLNARNFLHKTAANHVTLGDVFNYIAYDDFLKLLDTCDSSDETPLELIVRTGNVDLLKDIIAQCTRKGKLPTAGSKLIDILEKSGQTSQFALLALLLWDLKLIDKLSDFRTMTLLGVKDSSGRLMMHHVIIDAQLTKYQLQLIETIRASYKDLVDILTTTDCVGLTPLELGLLSGRIDELDDILDLMKPETVRQLIERRDRFGHNLFFYAAMSKEAAVAWYMLIKHYEDYGLLNALTQDREGNNPLMYVLCANEDPREILTMVCKQMPAWTDVKSIIQQNNVYGLSCSTVRTQIDEIVPFGSTKDRKRKITISTLIRLVKFEDGSIHFALKHSHHFSKTLTSMRAVNDNLSELIFFFLSCYGSSPMDNGPTIFLVVSPTNRYLTSTTKDSLKSITDSELRWSTVMLRYSHHSETLQTQVIDLHRRQVLTGSVQDLYKTFPRETSMSKLKVSVIHTVSTNLLRNAAESEKHKLLFDPPYPDIISFLIHHKNLYSPGSSVTFAKCEEWINQTSLPALINTMVYECGNCEELSGLTVISTATRDISFQHDPQPLGERMLVKSVFSRYDIERSETKCKALVICNKLRRPKWKLELTSAVAAISHFFDIETVYNLTTQEMLSKVECFSNEHHGSAAAVVVLSHGATDGRIMGFQKESDLCTVTQLGDAMNSAVLKGKPKVMILEFCRGNLKTVNKISEQEREIIRSITSKNSPGLYSGQSREHFGSTDIPDEDFFIVYSTLHDSRSHCGIFCQEVKSSIQEIVQKYPQGYLTDIETLFTDVARRVKINSYGIQFIQYTSTLRKRLIFFVRQQSRKVKGTPQPKRPSKP